MIEDAGNLLLGKGSLPENGDSFLFFAATFLEKRLLIRLLNITMVNKRNDLQCEGE